MVLFEIWSLGHKPFNDLSNPIVSQTLHDCFQFNVLKGITKHFFHLVLL